MALRLRSARAADAAAIAALHLASWRDAYRDALDPAFLAGPAEPLLAAHWEATLATRRRGALVILATAGRDVAGFVAATRDGTRCHVDSLHVRPGMRGAGIGRALLGFVAQRLAGQGARSVEFRVLARQAAAVHFFTGLGGVLGPEEEHHLFGQPVPQREVRWPVIETLIAACARPRSR